MRRRNRVVAGAGAFLGLVVVLALVWATGCGPTRSAPAVQPTARPGDTQVVMQTMVAQEAAAGGGAAAPAYYPVQADRKIIKDAQMEIQVEDTDTAVSRITGIATQFGGYIISTQSWYSNGYKEATVVIGVPAASFEQALERIRQVATRVQRESSSGQDVTDQYVDLQSQLRNLEATEARLREFLDKATTVEEALKVNTELSDIQGQIEVIKGKLNYIEGRSAFSTITVDIRPPRPTPTPTPTPTPAVWRPDQTFTQAGDTLGSIFRALVDLLIWVVVIIVPILGPPALIAWLIVWAVRRRARPKSPAPPPAGPPAASG